MSIASLRAAFGAAVLGLLLCFPGHAQTPPAEPAPIPFALDLGQARSLNLLLFDEVELSRLEVRGRVALGAAAHLQHAEIGQQLRQGSGGDGLLVEGALKLDSGQVFLGDIRSGAAAVIAPAVLQRLHPQQAVHASAELPYRPTQLRAQLSQLSQALAALAPNAQADLIHGGLRLQGDCNSRFQVFSLTAEQLNQAQRVDLNCVPPGATVVVNVLGGPARFDQRNLEAFSDFSATTLFNLPDAAVVELGEVLLLGSVLAPQAELRQQSGGAVFGSVFARSASGQLRIKHVPFRGIGAAEVCPLLPIGLPQSVLAQATPGSTLPALNRGPAPAGFGWLSWIGTADLNAMAESL